MKSLMTQICSKFSNFADNGKPPKRKAFDPVDYGLSESFVLTNFTKMKG